MTIEDARLYCISKPHATEDMPFGDDYVAFRVGGKIFAGLPLGMPGLLVLKCEASLFDEITEHFPSIEQAWHWHKRLWMQIHLDGDDISDNLVRDLIDKAYTHVFNRLSKKIRAELNRNG